MRRRQRPAGSVGDGVAGAGLCEQSGGAKVAQKDALNGLLDMRKSSDATAPGAGQQKRQGNQWIKALPWFDLEGMSRSLRAETRRTHRGVGGLRRTQRKPTDDPLAFDTRHSKMLLAKGQYLSSPSQNLNLRPSSIWLSEGENDLRTWPPGVRSSVHLRTRKGPCRTPSGRLFGPAGRLFRPSGHGHFKVALMSARPCLRRTPKQVERPNLT